jgi:hypothetical protein
LYSHTVGQIELQINWDTLTFSDKTNLVFDWIIAHQLLMTMMRLWDEDNHLREGLDQGTQSSWAYLTSKLSFMMD